MKMFYDAKKKCYQFQADAVEVFTTELLKNSLWNETQLHLIVETMVNFIDTVTEGFMTRGYIVNVVWLLQELQKLNLYVKKIGYYKEEDTTLQALRKPLSDYRYCAMQFQYQPRWITEIDQATVKPSQLCRGQFYELRLEDLQKDFYTHKQAQEGHTIIDVILSEALQALVASKSYQEARKKGGAYYDVAANIPKVKSFKELPEQKKLEVTSPYSPHFFKEGFLQASHPASHHAPSSKKRKTPDKNVSFKKSFT